MNDALAPPLALAFVIRPAFNVISLAIKRADAWIVAADRTVFSDGAPASATTATAGQEHRHQQR